MAALRARDLAGILGPGGALATVMPGYEARPGQLQMAEATLAALQRDGVLLVEAGTGTGKTLGYLLPAVLSGQRVVISTGTRALQDQIMRDALPLLSRLLGAEPSVAYMKGLSNYLCLRRYQAFLTGPASMRGAGARALPLLEDFAGHTQTGDLSELSLPAGLQSVLGEVCSGSDTRVGARCKHFDACFVTRMKQAAERAQLVVVNHHLFFADLALKAGGAAGYGGVIPDYDAVIFDEAHMVEDVATDFFGLSLSSAKLEALVRDAERVFSACRLGAAGEALTRELAVTASAFFAALPRPAAAESGRVPLHPDEFTGRVQAPMFALDTALDGIASFVEGQLERPEPLQQVQRRARQVQEGLSTIAEGGGRDMVTWTAQRGRGVQIGASPIDVAETLREELLLRGHGVVLTSATLTAGDSFEFVCKRLGIPEGAETLALPSPFDYAAQAALYLPRDIDDPRAQSFFPRAVSEVEALLSITGGGAFLLCTSLRAMHAFARRLQGALPYPVLVQGQAPSATLLERFRALGDAVLIATGSYWQGVDVPGDALRMVIMDKLPFDVPTDPLVQSRCERVEQAGDNPFMKYLVPSAALTLKQGFGRLIRSQRDRGIVAILDSRLSKKGYGKVLLRSLPPATRCATLAEVRSFWEDAACVSG